MTEKKDSPAYRDKKRFLDRLLTIYGRKPVIQVLEDNELNIHRLHLADSNRRDGIIETIIQLAETRNVEIIFHSRQALSRISKNSKQDQGVALDILCPGHMNYQDYLDECCGNNSTNQLIALDNVTNPQNLGMIIRSVCAGFIDGLLLPQKGCAKIDPLVIKASAGTLFKTPIIRSETLIPALEAFKRKGATLCNLTPRATTSLKDFKPSGTVIYVLGNETDGVSQKTAALCNTELSIPLNRNIESLNVAMTASLIAFRSVI